MAGNNNLGDNKDFDTYKDLEDLLAWKDVLKEKIIEALESLSR